MEGFAHWSVLGVYLETMAKAAAHVQLTRRARHWDSREQCAFVDRMIFIGDSGLFVRKVQFFTAGMIQKVYVCGTRPLTDPDASGRFCSLGAIIYGGMYGRDAHATPRAGAERPRSYRGA